ncbi:hypothetical protein T11_13025 [Trichinella zimbabwensis]|uniref:Uncharacterized protein n=1 Tax=Trichinella zimbabwensis TaxID=268475 RepID=A0A0V1I2R5_9BILA|nr:hypothetical protein T11_13025 [Trichinella zimbabwensis]
MKSRTNVCYGQCSSMVTPRKESMHTLFDAALSAGGVIISQHSIRAMTFNQTRKSRGRRTMVYAEIHKGIAAVLRVSILLSPIYRKVCRTSRNPSSTYRKWKAMDLDGPWLTMQPVLEHPGFKFQIFIDVDADIDGLDAVLSQDISGK